VPDEALIVIDMLNDFVLEGASLEVPDTRKVIPNIRREIEQARADGAPVIYVCDSHAPDDPEFERFGWPPHAVRGTKGAEIVDELKPAPGDHVLQKDTYSSFQKTGLHEILGRLGVKRLRLTGTVTHICILFAASDAVLLGYDVTVPADCVAGLAPEDHEAGLRIMKNVLGVKVL
jgi:nicotinamidase-related amidase